MILGCSRLVFRGRRCVLQTKANEQRSLVKVPVMVHMRLTSAACGPMDAASLFTPQLISGLLTQLS